MPRASTQAQVWSPSSLTREGSVGAQMRRLWSSPAALHSTLLLPSIPLGQGCSTDTICARKTTFGKRMGREVLSQNIYIRTAPVEKAVFLRKLPLYFTG